MTTDPNHNRKATKIHRLRSNLLASSLGVLLACSMTACNQKDAQVSTYEAAGSKAERVAEITKLLSKAAPLPGTILDGNLVQEQIGDGRLGPSDFFAFYALTVPAADIPAWRAALAASPVDKGTEAYAAPKAAAPWWVSKADYQKLELFGPKSLTGRSHGWVKLAPDGRIFIYAFTM